MLRRFIGTYVGGVNQTRSISLRLPMAAKPCKQADLRQNRLMCCVYLIETWLRIQRCMFKEKPHPDGQRPTLAASKSNLLIVIYTKGERSTPTDNKQVAEISQFPGHLGQVCTRQTAALTSITTNAQVCPEEHAQCLVFLSAQHSSAQNFACLRGPTETS